MKYFFLNINTTYFILSPFYSISLRSKYFKRHRLKEIDMNVYEFQFSNNGVF